MGVVVGGRRLAVALLWLSVCVWSFGEARDVHGFSMRITLGDGSEVELEYGWWPSDGRTTDRFCGAHGVSESDCAVLRAHATGLRDAMGRFFLASTEFGNSHAGGARPFAWLDGELMFRSTGSSNPGRNYPGVWLPTAGICPWWFQQLPEGFPRSFASDWFSEGPRKGASP